MVTGCLKKLIKRINIPIQRVWWIYSSGTISPDIETAFLRNEKKYIVRHYYNDIIEHPNRQIRLSFRFGNNNSCVFSIKKFELHGNQFFLSEIVNLNYRKIHHLYKNRYYVANKCEIIESNYNV